MDTIPSSFMRSNARDAMLLADGTLRKIMLLGRDLEKQAEKGHQFGTDRLLGVLDFRILTIRLSR
jgi:hypothetical protein